VFATVHASLAGCWLLSAWGLEAELSPPVHGLCYGIVCAAGFHPLTSIPWAIFVVASALHVLHRRAWARTRLEAIAWVYVAWAAIQIAFSHLASSGTGAAIVALLGAIHGIPWAIMIALLRSRTVRGALVDREPGVAPHEQTTGWARASRLVVPVALSAVAAGTAAMLLMLGLVVPVLAFPATAAAALLAASVFFYWLRHWPRYAPKGPTAQQRRQDPDTLALDEHRERANPR